jgi:tetratricopeptide (TPR) repeat protein
MSTSTRSFAGFGLAALLLGIGGMGCATARSGAEDERNQRRAQSHYEIGIDHMSNGRSPQALRELLLAERLRPDHPPTHFALANAYIYQGKLDEVEQHLLRALEIFPEYHDARHSLSTLYLQQARWQEAIEQTEILLSDPTFPAPWTAYSNQGWAELNLGRSAEARRNLEAARDYNPRYWPALLNLGILEQQAGHHLEAIELFQRMLDFDPDSNAEAEANYRIAEIYISLGKRQRALGHLMAAVAETPDGEWGRRSEEYLKLLR